MFVVYIPAVMSKYIPGSWKFPIDSTSIMSIVLSMHGVDVCFKQVFSKAYWKYSKDCIAIPWLCYTFFMNCQNYQPCTVLLSYFALISVTQLLKCLMLMLFIPCRWLISNSSLSYVWMKTIGLLWWAFVRCNYLVIYSGIQHFKFWGIFLYICLETNEKNWKIKIFTELKNLQKRWF